MRMPPGSLEGPIKTIELTEWDRVDAETHPALAEISLADAVLANPMVEVLRDRLNIFRRHKGLEIASTSFVGRLDLAPLRIEIRPKLPKLDLAHLLRYAYRLRDLTTVDETHAPTTAGGLHDLLIAMLAAEVEELLHRGPARQYVPLSGRLESPRGRILVQPMVREGGVTEARLPCRYFERHVNWDLNQVLRAGLYEAAQMTDDRDLRRHIHKLGDQFFDVEQKTKLEAQTIDRAQRSLTRLTEAYSSALSIIHLLHDMQGLDFGSKPQLHRIPGFLFDMNSFFQHLLSRFLHENLRGHRIVDESPTRTLFAYALHANPKKRRAPALRPDYSLFRGNVLRGFLDAKYRDVWEKDLPAEWLYQLAVYALASPNRVSVLLYGCMAANASDQQVDIRIAAEGISAVIIRPVPMMRLAEMVQHRHDARLAAERSRLANELVLLRAQSPS